VILTAQSGETEIEPKYIIILNQLAPQNNNFTQKYLIADEPPVNIDTNT
jgi:hypothetical protein